ncbi:MAG: hypothetical protein ACE5JO_13610 [Candidatus Binatia bacterium]
MAKLPLRIGMLIVMFSLWPLPSLFARDIRGSVDVNYRSSEDKTWGKTVKRWDAFETHTLSYPRSFSPNSSYTFFLTASFDQGEDKKTTRELTPRITGVSDNLYFKSSSSLIWRQEADQQGDTLTSRSSSSRITPKLSPLFPQLTLSRNSNREYDDRDTVDRSSQGWRLLMEYPLPILKAQPLCDLHPERGGAAETG